MPKIIYKYPVVVVGINTIEMPIGAEVISAGIDPRTNDICIWVEIDVGNLMILEDRKILLMMTGVPLEEPVILNRFIGTVVRGWFVAHIYTLV